MAASRLGIKIPVGKPSGDMLVRYQWWRWGDSVSSDLRGLAVAADRIRWRSLITAVIGGGAIE